MRSVDELKKMTHVVEYSPNCPSQYLVRLVGKGQGIIDKKPPGKTNDILGYGKTLAQAVKAALIIRRNQGANKSSGLLCIDKVSLCEPKDKPEGYCQFCDG
jgi:hypothetical protein